MKKHYDVCIAGFWYGSNYGSLLNGYAMYRVLKDYGKEVLMLHKPGASSTDAEVTTGHNAEFIHKYYDPEDISPVLPYDRLHELNDICDCFCAGSDQIWNYNLSFHENLYLPFVRDDKKLISFSTSFGHKKDRVPEEARDRIRKQFHRYSAISVREQFDVDILRNNYGVRSTLLFEPVFCIEKKYYTELAKNSKFDEKEPYLLTYILDPTPEKREAIQYYVQQSGLKVVNILNGVQRVWKQNKQILNLPNVLEDVSSEDFLKAFMNASYVITDSFHGSAFSIIFNRPFLAIGNYGRGYERFIDLLGRLKLMDRLVTNPKDIPHDPRFLEPVDFTETNRIIEEEAARTVAWVKNAIDTPKEKMPSIELPKTVTTALPSHLCAGCGACVSACPVDALRLTPDEDGYYRACVDYDKCINCGKCVKVCPALKLPEKTNRKEPKCYEFVAADSQVLKNSSSGGIFPLLAHEAFRRKGSVVGAAWQEDFSVAHIMINSEQDLPKLQKSKYLQSYLGNTFRQVEKKLKDGEFVLFSGCPCQVTGLKSYLGKEYDNLLTVDLLCGNSPSTRFFQEYLKEQFPEGLQAYEFRNKTEGWNWDGVLITLKNGEQQYRRGGKDDDYQRVYHNHTMCAPHCENCRYQETPRFGDLTIGDFWGIGGKDKTLNTRNGVSVILCNNEKGEKYLSAIPEEQIGVMKEVPLAWLGGNGYAINKSHNYCSPKRNQFYELVKAMPFSKAVDYALKPMHGEVVSRYQHTNTLLQFDMAMQRFKFNPDIWEEHTINGATVLFTKQQQTKPGSYAMMSLCRALEKGRKYRLDIKFRVNSTSEVVNLHIKDSGSSYNQVIYSHRNAGQNKGQWVQLSVDFVPNSKIYDEFMIGASQISGPDAYIAFEYIVISEV